MALTVAQMVRAAWRTYHPKRRPVRQTPEKFGMSAERFTVAGADDVRLACVFIPAPAGGDVVVVLGHGLGANSGMVMPLAKVLHDAGYHILAFDMRNHGESADDGLLRGQSPRYAIDHHRVVAAVRDRPGLGDVKVACLGFSMSAWTSLEAARLEPDLVRAVICDSGPTLEIEGTLRRMFDATAARLPRFMRGPMMSAIARASFVRAAVFFLKPAPWPQELGDHSIRLLFIAGEADPVARPADIKAQLACYPKAEVWFVPAAGHTQSYVRAADEYGSRVLALLAETFRPAAR
ncbi:alpha/beta fold hydrolase [Solwaraspora sp. WMMD1047]|uniref:alpha/beta hydrolase n=1 Tax=Solwaraspora sp. WMMD1047 TaxID=3016102 RepID=UPI002417E284|nr:alpha/beta fold hydrolase [Solwaraspora sp. WMMD1047]MDG4831709.1 alpha/beta fold hydrolase [Solwaraspora sp. WMMD1047]